VQRRSQPHSRSNANGAENHLDRKTYRQGGEGLGTEPGKPEVSIRLATAMASIAVMEGNSFSRVKGKSAPCQDQGTLFSIMPFSLYGLKVNFKTICEDETQI